LTGELLLSVSIERFIQGVGGRIVWSHGQSWGWRAKRTGAMLWKRHAVMVGLMHPIEIDDQNQNYKNYRKLTIQRIKIDDHD
jgi:hypothetical protein